MYLPCAFAEPDRVLQKAHCARPNPQAIHGGDGNTLTERHLQVPSAADAIKSNAATP
jgi:hypothetical protein